MKKILFIGILSILCISASFAQTRFGVTAGLNSSKLSVSGEENESMDFKAGLKAGLVADIGISEKFSIIPELLFSQRGGKNGTEEMENDKLETASLILNYMQLPVNVAYKFDVGYGSKFLIFAGPYLGYGISGKTKVEASHEGKKESQTYDLKFGSGDGETKPIDFGINAGIGYQYEKVFFKVQYNHGLSNLNQNPDVKRKNMNVAVTAGYFFN